MIRTLVASVIAALIAIPAAAQSTELGMMAGFTPAASLDRHAPELDGVSLDGGVTFSINGSRFLNEHWGIGVEWAQQLSGFVIETGDTDTTLYDISIAHLQGYAFYRFGDAAAKVRPFAFGGAGATFLWARDLESETKLSFGMGGGLSYFVSRNLALEGRLIYKPTVMNDSDAGISAIRLVSANRRCSSSSSPPASGSVSSCSRHPTRITIRRLAPGRFKRAQQCEEPVASWLQVRQPPKSFGEKRQADEADDEFEAHSRPVWHARPEQMIEQVIQRHVRDEHDHGIAGQEVDEPRGRERGEQCEP